MSKGKGSYRFRGAVFAVLTLLLAALSLAGWLALPDALAAGHRYAEARPCAGVPERSCLAAVPAKVVAVEPGSGKRQGAVTVDPGPGPAGRTRIGISAARTLAKAVRRGDTILVTWWEGSPVAVTAVGHRYGTGWEPDSDAALTLDLAVAPLAAAVVTGWGAVQGLRRQPRHARGAAWGALAVLLTLGLTGLAGGGRLWFTLLIQGLVLLVPAIVLFRWRRP
ncbi:hypothetical protein ABT095_24695 [Kitasatospora sp. NPDC002227]|uniref:hypothetical protein n=1 Tax=Kitasatospora sp. NPDC002227 TaxID=3154773 RepID=UPI003317F2F3